MPRGFDDLEKAQLGKALCLLDPAICAKLKSIAGNGGAVVPASGAAMAMLGLGLVGIAGCARRGS